MNVHFLILEDEPLISELIQLEVQKLGMFAQCVSSLKDVYHYLQSGKMDALIVDLSLFGESGLSILKHGPSPLEIPFAVFTGYDNPESREHAKNMGACHFLAKPASVEQLQELILILKEVAMGSR